MEMNGHGRILAVKFDEIYHDFREVDLILEFKHCKPKAELMLDEEDDTRELGKKKAHVTSKGW